MSEFLTTNPLYIGALLLAVVVPVYVFSSSTSTYLQKDAPLSASDLEDLTVPRKTKKKKKVVSKPPPVKQTPKDVEEVDEEETGDDVEINKRVESANPFALLEASQQQQQGTKKRNKKKNKEVEVVDRQVNVVTDHGAFAEMKEEGVLQVTEFQTTVTTTDATIQVTEAEGKKKKKKKKKEEETVHVVERKIEEDSVVKDVEVDGKLTVTQTHKETVVVDVIPEPATEGMTPVMDKKKKKKKKEAETEPAHAESVTTVVTKTVIDPQMQYEVNQLKTEVQMHRQQSLQAQMQMMQLEQANARLEEETRRLLREQSNVTDKHAQEDGRRAQLERKIKSLEEREEQLKYTNRILFEQLSEAKEREKGRLVGAIGTSKNGIPA
jgi:hypothetical protein